MLRVNFMKRLLCFILTVFFISGCTAKDSVPAEKSLFAMDTYMKLSAYGNGAETALNAAADKLAFLDGLWSVTDGKSEIYALNSSGGEPVTVSPETAEALSLSLQISGITGGALDCTVYPVLAEWGFTTGDYKIPDEERIAVLLKDVGYEKVSLSGCSVSVPEGTRIDLGAVGKGCAGDILAEIMAEKGISSALLDLGGNIQAIGAKPDGTPWRIGLRDPSGDGIFAALELTDCAAVTSGGYERYFIGENGESYCHIIDPSTGEPARSGLVSATVISDSGGLCDALSTAIFVMGLDKASELWRSRRNFEMVLVADGGKIYVTEGLEDRFRLMGKYSSDEVNIINCVA